MKVVVAAAAMAFSVSAGAQGGGVPKPMDGLPIKGIHNVGITVSDIDATVAFYSKAVPYKVVKRFKVRASAFPRALLAKRRGEVEIALVEMPTMFIQLMDFDPGTPAAPNPVRVIGPGYTHICFQSSSKAPAVARFMSAGLANISRFGKPDGVDIGGYGVRYAYGRDPDGIMIENESLDAPRRTESSWVTHIANVVHDREAMMAFYTRMLGFPPHRTIEQEKRPRLDDVANIDDLAIKGGWFSVGNMEIEVWHYTRPQTPPPTGDRKLDAIGYNSFALEVADLKAETKRLKSLGVRLAGRPATIGGWIVQYAYDPEGNLFTVQQNVTAGAPASIDRFVWIPRPAPQ
jgi:catechol 2,3-dioxygenase-like lactoylglutathione lyase family enzyme